MYQRVIPRDLFNEAKLLKCLGRLCLLIEDGLPWPLRYDFVPEFDPSSGFVIGQDSSDGGLYVYNLSVFCGEQELCLCSCLNSKAPWPLVFTRHDTEAEGDVFNEDGSLSVEFMGYLTDLTKAHKKEAAWRSKLHDMLNGPSTQEPTP